MMMKRNSRNRSGSVALTAIAALLLLAPQSADAQSSFPEDPQQAMTLYEGAIDDWADGPVSYILTRDEEDLWEELATREEREAFIEWFWERRDEDLRDDRNEYREAFYERVAEANDRYHGLPRGWRSDQGRIHVVLGRPHAVRPEFGVPNDAVIWTYYTVGPRAKDMPVDASLGEFAIAFVRRAPRTGYQIYGGFGGPGIFPRYVNDVLRFAVEASIVNPFLETDLS